MQLNSNIILSEKEFRLYADYDKLVEDLTLPNPAYAQAKRFGKGKFVRASKYLTYLCRDSRGKLIIPRNYFESLKGKSIIDERVQGRTISFKMKFSLRDYQKDFFEEHKPSLLLDDLLFEAPCGHGKTICSLFRANMLQKQTVVLVPTNYLANQWHSAITNSTDASCHVVKSTDKAIPTEMDFTIISMDLFSVRCLPKDFLSNVGHVILDEAHRVGAETYVPILNELPAKCRTALTATFRRTDGVHKILKFHFGKHIVMPNRFPKPLIYAVETSVNAENVFIVPKQPLTLLNVLERLNLPHTKTNSTVEFPRKSLTDDSLKNLYASKDTITTKKDLVMLTRDLRKANNVGFATLETYLSEHSRRRKMTISLIQSALDNDRTVLFLSKRKEVLIALHKYFKGYNPALITSASAKDNLKSMDYITKKCRLIFGVNQLAKEGLDIDRLDTLIIHLPMVDTEQAVGRISRLHPDKKQPVVMYLLDKAPYAYSAFCKAKKDYFDINGKFSGFVNVKQMRRLL